MLSHCHRKLNLILIKASQTNNDDHLSQQSNQFRSFIFKFKSNPRSHPSDPEHDGYRRLHNRRVRLTVVLAIQHM